ncbi:Hpt domain-containing protein [Undibacterium flavidum]|uniref:Hpt domain-containing protein n=1 Tax=Undibacterium flavidum TaxID=2762297 RepID=A0ABR6YG10_9BURK|nr:Hpt domain-containing protein [Undibacterium flavidum]MBC3875447.1 Hpt domain-containing protein [Undibacterium flavidum]
MLQQLRTTYLNELPTRLNDIEHAVMALEKSGFIAEDFNSLFRLVHSLKGSGGTYGIYEITNICHPLEDSLSEILEHPDKLTRAFTDIALAYIDLLRDVVDDYSFNDECQIDIEGRLQELRHKAFPSMRTALIVERSNVLIVLLRECLKDQHVRAEIVNDGYVALGRALTESFDFVISSMEVHRLNGAAIIAALGLAQGKKERTKTILLTTNKANIPSVVKPDFTVVKDAQLHRNISEILNDTTKTGKS